MVEKHLKERKGEEKRRLADGHGHAEKLFLERVWYPVMKQLDYLHPEYKVADFKDGARFLDFAFLKAPLQLAIEIDGFRSHAADISRWQFSDSLMRQNHLILDGWTILRFSYDDINEKPRMCQQIIQQLMGTWIVGETQEISSDIVLEREIMRFAHRRKRLLRPIDVCESILRLANEKHVLYSKI